MMELRNEMDEDENQVMVKSYMSKKACDCGEKVVLEFENALYCVGCEEKRERLMAEITKQAVMERL